LRDKKLIALKAVSFFIWIDCRCTRIAPKIKKSF